ncbi:MAG: site-specific integrase, partial [Planctomycetaceae bacterium]|nr:site-specific integrase [Planctomycetaceae bacterium]
AHDLRRSYGERLSQHVPAQILMQMMRHESIETTLKYYVGRNAESVSETVFRAFQEGVPI